MAKKKVGFPETVFVTWYEDGDERYLTTCEHAADAMEREERHVAIYKLVEVQRGKLVAQFRKD